MAAMSRRSAVVWLLAGLAALLIGYFGFFFYRDNFATHYPLKSISAETLRSGSIPWWNFHDSGGQPLAGNPNALTFYPDTLLFLFLPAHVAFNLHFLIHWIAAWLVMRALCVAAGASLNAARFGATVYALSGVVISASAFYNLMTAVVLIPLAFLAAERRSARLLGLAFGLMLLAAEPVTLLGGAIGVLVISAGRMTVTQLAFAAAMGLAIGSPQIIAYSEIAGEVERVVGFSSETVLRTSLTPLRIAEIFLWPFSGFLNDAGGLRVRLFSTLFVGIIAIPAAISRSRYTLVLAAMLFLAMGEQNPLIRWVIEELPALRIIRFPEKFVLVLVPALVVLIARFFNEARFKIAWILITIGPLLWITWRALPIDWFEPYRVTPVAARRVHQLQSIVHDMPARAEYRARAARLEPLFGATAGLRYGIVRSPDGMHSLLSRLVAERFAAVPPPLRERYLRIHGCDVPGALPDVFAVQRVIVARDLQEAVTHIESPSFDEQSMAVVPMPLAVVPGGAPVIAYRERRQRIEIELEPVAEPFLLMVNQSYFGAWVARAGERELEILPVNLDRLGVIVPPGTSSIALQFGRRRQVIAATWAASLLLLVALPLIEKRDRRSRQIERSADEDGPHP
jgi:hypothetical protein